MKINRTDYHQKRWGKIRMNQPWYSHYRAAKSRCNNPNHSHYHRYGGRNIKFKLSLEQVKQLWFRDKAYLLKQPSIDRIDNDGDYVVDNCRFIELHKNVREKLPVFHCRLCNKIISKTSGKYGKGRCGSCAKSIDQKNKWRKRKMKTKIFFAVDCQKDFMNKDGALYVPNAENIKPNLAKLSKFALDNKITVVASMDTHYGDEEHKGIETELKRNGGPFPDHCMKDSEGQTSIDETKGENNITIIEKQTYDVFSNPETKNILKDVKEAVVYGVATDYCIKAAVLGMLKMGIKVTVVGDAIKGVEEKTSFDAIKEMMDKEAEFKKTEEVLKNGDGKNS